MNSKINFLGFLVLLFIVSCTKSNVPKAYLIGIEEFKELSEKSHVKIIDFRKVAAYNEGHIKNSIQIWRSDIEDHSFPYGGMKASKEQLEVLFGNLGIANEDTLLIFDDKGQCDAARLWWVLQYYNFKNVKLLDGGFSTVKTASIPLTNSKTINKPTEFSFSTKVNKQFYASKEQLNKAVENGATIVDTRTSEEYLGKTLKKGAFLNGRILNSQLLDWANAINYSGDKKLKTKLQLEEIYANIGAKKNDTIFVYCHSGVRSAHTTFVLTQLLGYKHVLNYDGSWTEWSYYKKKEQEK